MTLLEILDVYQDEELLMVDGFDEAVIGIEALKLRLVYDINKMRSILIERDEMTFEEAMDFLDHNVLGSYVGEQTPIYVEI
jgi:hypothetical protein